MRRFDLWLVSLDPTIGSEIKKTRAAIIVSPDELNEHLYPVIVVPLTKGKECPFRVATKIVGKPGVAALDQIRTVDKRRLVKKLTTLPKPTRQTLLNALAELFAL
jgi:mRNA interferase MazF